MVQVAKDYGFSDRGMSKLCERYAIPVPPRGYWAKKQAGHIVTKPPLIVLASDKPETLILFRQAVTKVKEALDKSQEPKAGYPPEIKAAIDREKLKDNLIKVRKSLVNLHPIVDRWLEYQRSRYDSYTRYGGIKPDQLTALEKRSWRILIDNSSPSSLMRTLRDNSSYTMSLNLIPSLGLPDGLPDTPFLNCVALGGFL